MKNHTITDCTLDDLVNIQSINNLIVQDTTVRNHKNTGSIASQSAIFRILNSANTVTIFNYDVQNSNFQYGRSLEVDTALTLNFYDNLFVNNSVTIQDLIVLNRIRSMNLRNSMMKLISKDSEK
jgi:hypothetical protein